MIHHAMEVALDDALQLLWQVDAILHSDPLIDEIGFVHPSQLADLHASAPSSLSASSPVNASYLWCGDHKLAISVRAQVPVCKAARDAFLSARKKYRQCLGNAHGAGDLEALQQQLLGITRALALVNPGHRTAWNARKEVLKDASWEVILADMQICNLVLSYDPKCEEAWAHRRWIISSMLQSLYWKELPDSILEKELRLVEKIADRSRMNYRAWRHCSWLVSLLTDSQASLELDKHKNWAQGHAADNCCFHFRRCLILRVLSGGGLRTENLVLQDEIAWNEDLIKFYIGREALWVHRRFLFIHLSQQDSSKHILSEETINCNDQQTHSSCQLPSKEIGFADGCISLCDDDRSEDSERQIIYAATYKVWVLVKWREICPSHASHAEVWSREISLLEKLLKRKACHQENLWKGIFGEYIKM